MVGIVSCGAYIPFFRLKKEEIARALGGRAAKGEKAVANFDEDAITMGVAASLDCLQGFNYRDIDALFFASTTMPYLENQNASIVAAALDLRPDAYVAEFSGSLRAGVSALCLAFDAVKSGSFKNILVVASDCRLSPPGSSIELDTGDGAAAFIVSDSENALAVPVATYSSWSEVVDIWRRVSDRFIMSWEDRFAYDESYTKTVLESFSKFKKEKGVEIRSNDILVLYAPDERRHRRMTEKLGFDPSQVQDSMFDKFGNTGCAFVPMLLTAVLERTKKGDGVFVVGYGGGCEILQLEVKKEMDEIPGRRGITGFLESKAYLKNYEKYLTFRKFLVPEAERRRPPLLSSSPVLWRDRRWIFGFNASRCRRCGRLFFPPQRICLYCQSKDDFDYVRLTGREGTLFTFTLDYLARGEDPPEVFAKVYLEGGVGVYCRMTDRIPEEVEIGMPVEMTFRKFHEGSGYPNYFWKCMPVRRRR